MPEDEVESKAADLVQELADGPTLSYAAVKQILKAWSSGGVPGADAVMLDVDLSLHAATDAARERRGEKNLPGSQPRAPCVTGNGGLGAGTR